MYPIKFWKAPKDNVFLFLLISVNNILYAHSSVCVITILFLTYKRFMILLFLNNIFAFIVLWCYSSFYDIYLLHPDNVMLFLSLWFIWLCIILISSLHAFINLCFYIFSFAASWSLLLFFFRTGSLYMETCCFAHNNPHSIPY